MINLMHGDCLSLMANIPNDSVDMILADLPYSGTRSYHSSHYGLTTSASIVLFGSQPFI